MKKPEPKPFSVFTITTLSNLLSWISYLDEPVLESDAVFLDFFSVLPKLNKFPNHELSSSISKFKLTYNSFWFFNSLKEVCFSEIWNNFFAETSSNFKLCQLATCSVV